MLSRLRHHPLAMTARFRDCLVLTVALPRHVLDPLLPRYMELDLYNGHGLLAIAMVRTEAMRPRGCPSWLGLDTMLVGYRVYAKYRTRQGRVLRGLRILKSETDRQLLKCAGNRLTGYNYECVHASMSQVDSHLVVCTTHLNGTTSLHVRADVGTHAQALPASSVFECIGDARRFAGPLPYTFDCHTDHIVLIKGERRGWTPRLVDATIKHCSFFKQDIFRHTKPRLCSAWYMTDVNYTWLAGVTEQRRRIA